ncbi:hypothetical protein D3C72_2346440 [compost metagenome]
MLNERRKYERTASIAGVNSAFRLQARPISMDGIGSVSAMVSIRFPSSDQGRWTMSDRIATP